MNFDWNEFVVNGYCKTTYDNVDDIPIDDVSLDICLDHVLIPSTLSDNYKSSIDNLVSEVVSVLRNTYSQVTTFKYDQHSPYNVWDGVDSDSAKWHNDGNEGGDVFMLLYLDDVPKEAGGLLSIKMNDEIVKEFYPQKGEIVFISNEPNVLHKAERANVQRRLINLTFDCIV